MGFFFRKSIFCNFPCNMFHFRSKGLGPVWAHLMHFIIKKPGGRLGDDLGHCRIAPLQLNELFPSDGLQMLQVTN